MRAEFKQSRTTPPDENRDANRDLNRLSGEPWACGQVASPFAKLSFMWVEALAELLNHDAVNLVLRSKRLDVPLDVSKAQKIVLLMRAVTVEGQ